MLETTKVVHCELSSTIFSSTQQSMMKWCVLIIWMPPLSGSIQNRSKNQKFFHQSWAWGHGDKQSCYSDFFFIKLVAPEPMGNFARGQTLCKLPTGQISVFFIGFFLLCAEFVFCIFAEFAEFSLAIVYVL